MSHDLAKDNLVNMNKILIWTTHFFFKVKKTETALDSCRKNDDAVPRITVGRSRW